MYGICSAKFPWTREELRRAKLHHQRAKLRRGFRLLLKVFSAFLLVLFGAIIVVEILSSGSLPPYGILLMLPACILGLMFERVNAWYWGLGFTRRRHANNQVDLQFSRDGMRTQTEFVDSTMHWKSFLKVVETTEGFLFYPQKNLFLWVPFSAFELPACVEKVRELVRENGIQLIAPRADN